MFMGWTRNNELQLSRHYEGVAASGTEPGCGGMAKHRGLDAE